MNQSPPVASFFHRTIAAQRRCWTADADLCSVRRWTLAAWPLTGVVAGLLYGVQPTDPTTVAAVLAVLLVVGSIAMCFPSWRATQVDPVAVLKRG